MKINRVLILFSLILLLGIFARVWEFPNIPPGFNQDEAVTAVDSYNLLHYGVDSNGMSFPVHAISFGSGQNTPYIYLLIPFLAVGGLSVFTVRLPMLLLGILTLPMVFYAGKRIMGTPFGLLVMFFMAISPWHILMSRWALESNILPFLFLAGFIFLLKTDSQNHWFILACFILGLTPYAYGSAYVVAPITLACASLILFKARRLNLRTLLIGWAVAGLAAAPMVLYVLINHFKWDTLHIWLLTIPRMPARARFERMLAFNSPYVLSTIKKNTYAMLNIIWHQEGGPYYNYIGPYGYFYTYSSIFAVIGALGLLPFFKSEKWAEKLLLLVWLLACIPVGMLEPLIISRFNIIFIPLILTMAVPLMWLTGRLQHLRWLPVAALLVLFAAFTRDYHDQNGYSYVIGRMFYNGIIPAIQSAHQTSGVPICVTDKVAEPYIYALFADPIPPAEFISSARYVDPNADFHFVTSYGRYAFGLKNCPKDPQTIYVLGEKEQPPDPALHYRVETFDNYQVYRP